MICRTTIASILIGMTLAAGASAADRQTERRVRHGYSNAKPRAVPEFDAGSVGGAAAVVAGGLLALAGYRKKRRTTT